jgi:hypothetical protein
MCTIPKSHMSQMLASPPFLMRKLMKAMTNIILMTSLISLIQKLCVDHSTSHIFPWWSRIYLSTTWGMTWKNIRSYQETQLCELSHYFTPTAPVFFSSKCYTTLTYVMSGLSRYLIIPRSIWTYVSELANLAKLCHQWELMQILEINHLGIPLLSKDEMLEQICNHYLFPCNLVLYQAIQGVLSSKQIRKCFEGLNDLICIAHNYVYVTQVISFIPGSCRFFRKLTTLTSTPLQWNST